MRFMKILALGAFAWAVAGATAHADVLLTIHDGRVSLVAKDATVRQILEAWARIGQTKIVNVEKIAGGPQSLQFTDMPEAAALEVLLRSVSGYLAAPRAVPVANASNFDRIVVMPTSVAPPAPPAAAGRFPQPGQPVFVQPGQQMPQQPADDDQDDERQPPNIPVPNRGAVFNQFQQPQLINPQQGGPAFMPGFTGQPQQQMPPGALIPNPPTGSPSQPATPFGGTATPGMIAQPPPQPGQPIFGQPIPPRRPGQE